MRAVVQRVATAEVRVAEKVAGWINEGLLVLVGVHREDTDRDVSWLADKLVHLRIFEDAEGLMNQSLLDTGAEMLIVSQFTLLGDCRKGRRPSFSTAAPPETADAFYRKLVDRIRTYGIRTATGEFQAMMDVSLVNRGPVTLILDSHKNI
jgi:D-tyrosyl-tRNA(Tyr) deacylase